jgi:hypothetical protein
MNFTFGRSPAAEMIEKLVVNNPPARRKISRLLSRYTRQLLEVTRVHDPGTVKLVMELLYKHNLRNVDAMKIDADVKNYIKNLVVARYRVFLHQYNILLPLINLQRKQTNH